MKINRLLIFLFFVVNISFAQKRNGTQFYTNVSDVRAETIVPRPNDMIVVTALGKTFYFDATTTATDDGTTIIKQASISTGRFVALGGASSTGSIFFKQCQRVSIGWNNILPDGDLIPLAGQTLTSLTVAQRNVATTKCGYVGTLPSVVGKTTIGAGTGFAPFSTQGASTVTLLRANLPTVTLTGSSSTSFSSWSTDLSAPGAERYLGGTGTGGGLQTIVKAGTVSVPLGGSDTPFSVLDPSIAFTEYVYLGSSNPVMTIVSESDPIVAGINGIVKSDGTTISAAIAGTDYLSPTGSAAGLTGFPTFNQNTTGTANNVSGIVAIANGGTGSATKNFVDLSTAQTILGDKTFNGNSVLGSVAGNTTTIGNNTGNFSVNSNTSVFSQNGVEKFRLHSNGFVGVGINAPTAPIHIYAPNVGTPFLEISQSPSALTGTAFSGLSATQLASGGLFFHVARIGGFASVSTIIGGGITGGNFSSVLDFATTASGGVQPFTRMRIVGNGNVGIGMGSASTGVPTSKLQVHESTAATGVVLKVSNAGSGQTVTDGLGLEVTAGSQARIWNYENVEMVMGTNNAERMRITNGGLVGIANAAPTRTLDVTGTLGVSSNIQVATTNTTENVNIGAGLKFYGGSLAAWGTGTQGGIDASGGVLRLQGASGLSFIYGAGNTSASINSAGTFTHNTSTVFSSNVQFGGTAPGSIGIRFGNSYTFNYVGSYGYLSPSGTTGTGTSTGAIGWSFETDGRILTVELNVKSDKRAKKDINIFDPKKALDFVNKVNAKSYRWDDGRTDNSPKIGFLAQDIGEAGLGEAVSFVKGKVRNKKGELVEVDDFHVLDKEQLMAVLWAAVKEQQNEIKLLKQSINHAITSRNNIRKRKGSKISN